MFTVSFVYEADDIRCSFGPFSSWKEAAAWAYSACAAYCAWMNSTGENYTVAGTEQDVLEEGFVRIYDAGRFHELEEVYFTLDDAPQSPALFDPSRLLEG